MPDPNPYESPRATNSEPDIDTQAEPYALPKPLEPYGVVAFVLAVALLFFPVLADLLAGLAADQQLLLAVALAIGVYASVLIPTTISWRRHLQAPSHWRGYGCLLAATIILGFHAVVLSSGAIALTFF